jgi:predicted RNA-binding protein with PUA-like domain
MATFLVKTEPTTYSLADLQREKQARWDGVSNPAALQALRTMRTGDEAFIYHSGDDKAIAGLARILGPAYEDPKRPGLNDAGQPKFAVVDLQYLKPAKTPTTLAQITADARFKDFALVRQSRLSVMPVPPALDKALRALTGL